MIDAIKEKCDLLVRNRSEILKKFSLQDSLMGIASGLIFTMNDQEADVEKMKECRKLLKKETRPLSNLRAKTELILLSKMAMAEDPGLYLTDVLDVYKKVCHGKILEDSYMVLAAILIVDFGRKDESEEIVTKAGELMKRLNKIHPFLTDSDDTSYVMLLALTDKSIDSIVADVDEGYRYLKKTPKLRVKTNALFELCEALAVSYGDMKDKCDKAVRIYRVFAARRAPFGTEHEFASLCPLVDVDMEPETIVDEILETEAILERANGFDDKSMDRKKRMMYATLLLADVCGRDPASVNDTLISNPVISNTISILKAKQVSLMMSVAGSIFQTAMSIASAMASEEDSEKTSEEKSEQSSEEESKPFSEDVSKQPSK